MLPRTSTERSAARRRCSETRSPMTWTTHWPSLRGTAERVDPDRRLVEARGARSRRRRRARPSTDGSIGIPATSSRRPRTEPSGWIATVRVPDCPPPKAKPNGGRSGRGPGRLMIRATSSARPLEDCRSAACELAGDGAVHQHPEGEEDEQRQAPAPGEEPAGAFAAGGGVVATRAAGRRLGASGPADYAVPDAADRLDPGPAIRRRASCAAGGCMPRPCWA